MSKLSFYKIIITYDVPRKLLLGLVAAINSEVLSTNRTFATLFSDPLLLTLYFLSFCVMDELVQKYHWGRRSIFYMGALFGLVVEGFVAFTLHTSPFTMIPIIAIAWHGLITTLAAFIIVDVLILRRREKKLNKVWLLVGSLFWIILLFITIGAGFRIIVSYPLVYETIIALCAVFLFLILQSARKSVTYTPKIYFAMSIILLGFVLGLFIQKESFAFIDYFVVATFYIAIFVALQRKRRATVLAR